VQADIQRISPASISYGNAWFELAFGGSGQRPWDACDLGSAGQKCSLRIERIEGMTSYYLSTGIFTQVGRRWASICWRQLVCWHGHPMQVFRPSQAHELGTCGLPPSLSSTCACPSRSVQNSKLVAQQSKPSNVGCDTNPRGCARWYPAFEFRVTFTGAA